MLGYKLNPQNACISRRYAEFELMMYLQKPQILKLPVAYCAPVNTNVEIWQLYGLYN